MKRKSLLLLASLAITAAMTGALTAPAQAAVADVSYFAVNRITAPYYSYNKCDYAYTLTWSGSNIGGEAHLSYWEGSIEKNLLHRKIYDPPTFPSGPGNISGTYSDTARSDTSDNWYSMWCGAFDWSTSHFHASDTNVDSDW